VKSNPPAPAVIAQLGVKSTAAAHKESDYTEYSTEENEGSSKARPAPVSKPIPDQSTVKSHPPRLTAVTKPAIGQPEVKSTASTQIETKKPGSTTSISSDQTAPSVQSQNPELVNFSLFLEKMSAAFAELTVGMSKAGAILAETQTALSQALSESKQPTNPTVPNNPSTLDPPPSDKSDQPPKTVPRPAPVRQTDGSGEQKPVIPRKPPNLDRKQLNRDNFEDRGDRRRDNRQFPGKDVFRRKAQDNLLGEHGKNFKGEKHKCKNGSYGQTTIDSNRSGSKKLQ
jgi:hypothetical protein